MSQKPWVLRKDGGLVAGASVIGQCLRSLVASAMGIHASQLSDEVARIFQLGHLHEDAVVSRMSDLGYECVQRQRPVVLDLGDELAIAGSADGVVRPRRSGLNEPVEAVLEIKSTSPDDFSEAEAEVSSWFCKERAFAFQASAYMLGSGLPMLLMVIEMNSAARHIRDALGQPILKAWLTRPPVSVEALRQRLKSVRDHLDRGDLPDCDGGWFCQPGTPYWHVHESAT